jgi:hypothetical protein
VGECQMLGEPSYITDLATDQEKTGAAFTPRRSLELFTG